MTMLYLVIFHRSTEISIYCVFSMGQRLDIELELDDWMVGLCVASRRVVCAKPIWIVLGWVGLDHGICASRTQHILSRVLSLSALACSTLYHTAARRGWIGLGWVGLGWVGRNYSWVWLLMHTARARVRVRARA